MTRKDAKEFKISKENATKEFNQIIEVFGFNISSETKERIIKMKVNSIDMETSQEINTADSFITKIMEGKIKFDEVNEEIIYIPRKPIQTGSEQIITTSEFRFGQFTRAKQKSTKIALNECNFQTLDDSKQDKLLMALTGISDEAIFGKLSTVEYNDLRMVGTYYFN